MENIEIVDPTKPRIFTFEPNSWGNVWHVLAFSPTQALRCLIMKLKENSDKENLLDRPTPYYSLDKEIYNNWENATIDNLPSGYHIKETPPFEIIETEYS